MSGGTDVDEDMQQAEEVSYNNMVVEGPWVVVGTCSSKEYGE
jgi:hypothetical protein